MRSSLLAVALSSISGVASAATAWDHTNVYDAGGIKLGGFFWSSTDSVSWTFDLTPGFDPATEEVTSGEIWLDLRDDKDYGWKKKYLVEFAQLEVGDVVSDIFDVDTGTTIYTLTSFTSLNFDGTLDVTLTATKGDFYFDQATLVVHDQLSAVPVPAAVWLFGSGLLGLAGFARAGKKA